MTRLLTYVACAAIVFLPACKMLTPQQRQAGVQAIEEAYQEGQLTAGQRQDAIDALTGQQVDWTDLLTTGGSIIASILLGVPIAVRTTNKIRDRKYHEGEKITL